MDTKGIRLPSPSAAIGSTSGGRVRKPFLTMVVSRFLWEGVCLLLQYQLQSCSRGGGGGKVEDMCYERRRAEACVDCPSRTSERGGEGY
jgi:hypothetical protein